MDNSKIVAVLAVAKTEGGVDIEIILAIAKTGDMAVCSWEGNILAVAVITAKTDGGDVDIATRKDKIVDILAVAVITAKTGRLLAKNVVKKKDSGDKNVENDLSWLNLI